MDEKAQKEYKRLLLFTTPQRMKASLQRSLCSYVDGIDELAPPIGFTGVVQDHLYLIDFFESIEVGEND